MPARISGVYEICIGVETLAEQESLQTFFSHFGFGPPTPSGTLTPSQSARQYCHTAHLTSVRLAHGASDHGLIRIWRWSHATPGPGVGPLKARGRRWGAVLTDDVFNISNHVQAAQAADEDLRTVGFDVVTGVKKVLSKGLYSVQPVGFSFYDVDPKERRPFFDKLPAVHEMVVVGELTALVFYQRHDIDLPRYGRINTAARFPCSQINHCGLVTTGDGADLGFYERTLGMGVCLDTESAYNSATEGLLDTARGDDRVFIKAFGTPAEWENATSGRLETIRWVGGEGVGDVREVCNPGCRGMSGYTLRVRGVEEFRRKVLEGGGERVSEVEENEFGERAFAFQAPDGYWWQLIEWE